MSEGGTERRAVPVTYSNVGLYGELSAFTT